MPTAAPLRRGLLVLTVAIGIAVLPGSVRAADHDCSDFATQAAAQTYFGQQGYTATNDPERLDADQDGRPCESNPCPCAGVTPLPPAPPAAPVERSIVRVVRVVDGDTVRVRSAGGQQTVRVLGIDAPEFSSTRYGTPDCGGKQAKTALERLLPARSAVRMTSDRTQALVDRYGRLLRYVSRLGSDAGRRMIRGGWAATYTRGEPFARIAAYTAAAAAARSDTRGVWRACGGDFHTADS